MSADQEWRLLLTQLRDYIEQRIRAAIPFTRDGKLDLSSKNIVGTLPPSSTGSEPALGNPASDGDVLSSTTAGVRSWVAPTAAATLDDLTDVTLTSPADTEVLTYDAGSATWINAAAPGAGSGAPTTAKYVTTATDATLSAELAIPGLAGSADIAGAAGGGTLSEEFDTASPTGWAWTPSTPATFNVNTDAKSRLHVAQADATPRYYLKAWTPAGAFDLRAHVAAWPNPPAGTSGMSVGIWIADSGNTNAYFVAYEHADAWGSIALRAYTVASGAFTQRGTTVSNALALGPYLRIARDASNVITYYASPDGLAWWPLAQVTQALTVAHAGYRINVAGAEFYADWIRANV